MEPLILVKKALIAPMATILAPQGGKYVAAASAIADCDWASVSAGNTPKATKAIEKNMSTDARTPLTKIIGSVRVGSLVSPATWASVSKPA